MPPDRKVSSSFQRQLGVLNTGRVLGVAAFLTLPVALFASKGLAPLYIVTALIILTLSNNRRHLHLLFPLPLSGFLATFILLAGVSAWWSIAPSSSLRSALNIGLSGFGGLVLAASAVRLEKSQRVFFEKALIVGGTLGLFLIMFEQSSDWILTRWLFQMKGQSVQYKTTMALVFNPGMTISVLYIWPWLLIIRKKLGPWSALLALVMALIAIFLSEAETPLLALVLGLVVASASLVSRKLVFGLFGALIVIGTVTAPLLPGALPDPETETSRYPTLSHSALHRLSIWRTAGERIAERPVFGFGMNATRHLYNESDKTKRFYDTDDPNKKSWFNNFEPIPLHVHNGVLQIWLELGAFGALLLLGVLLAVLKLVYQKIDDTVHSAFGLGMLTSGLFIFSASFGPWQSWWHSGLWLLACFMVATVNGREVKPD